MTCVAVPAVFVDSDQVCEPARNELTDPSVVAKSTQGRFFIWQTVRVDESGFLLVVTEEISMKVKEAMTPDVHLANPDLTFARRRASWLRLIPAPCRSAMVTVSWV